MVLLRLRVNFTLGPFRFVTTENLFFQRLDRLRLTLYVAIKLGSYLLLKSGVWRMISEDS